MTSSIEMAVEVLAAIPEGQRLPLAAKLASSTPGASALAGSSACPVSVLESLAGHPAATVRRRVAVHPATPVAVRKRLLQDKAASVRSAARLASAAPEVPLDPHAYTPDNISRYVKAARGSYRSGCAPKGVPLFKLVTADARWAQDPDLIDALLAALPSGSMGQFSHWSYGAFISALTRTLDLGVLVGRVAVLASRGELAWSANDVLSLIIGRDDVDLEFLHRLLDPHAPVLASVAGRGRPGIVEALTSSKPKVLFDLAAGDALYPTAAGLLAYERAIEVSPLKRLVSFASSRLKSHAGDLAVMAESPVAALDRRLADRLGAEGVAPALVDAGEPAALLLAAMGYLDGLRDRALDALLAPIVTWRAAHPSRSLWDGPWQVDALLSVLVQGDLPEAFQLQVIALGDEDLIDELVGRGRVCSKAVVALVRSGAYVQESLLDRVDDADVLDLPWQVARAHARLRAAACERLAAVIALDPARADTLIALDRPFDGSVSELVAAVTHL